ncbi:MAG TPA: dTDP-4-dehydrorhamnose 3,5-epimerase [Haliea salexigens]|jgi:dTDP-4-dehydrorhamnose 3,5-epimerase|uniref:dTDP-4-dehydrorhamnose 3,5-epimerase n=1 Tax=Haliea salexigens TaxID=287487 RepID=A0A3C1KLD8_9GAMM|nr:dTDP-4-dehydrorhamnose 3,5-epimerase [Haliea salexigens]HAN27253.1 dTDP-4-dehydrorhamnose 3,5-epimerase [Haliea salexigens]|tara:strand:- start:45298 stop:45846 length:549 start_codon:yes stop_codon:yes gene_type:complete
MIFESTPLAGLVVLEPRVFGDERGFFLESWNATTFRDAGLDVNFVQDNHSRSAQGILRGLHYQTEQPQGKLVRVTAGAVFDVAVDLRRGSPTLGQWYGLELSAANHRMLWVPPGFAHGFYVLSEFADFQYKCSDYYHPASEVSLAWDDPTLGIEWPVPAGDSPKLSAKDAAGQAWGSIPLFD